MDRIINEKLTRQTSIKPQSINEQERTVEVIFATEKPILRHSISGSYWEKMLVTPETTNLSRLKSGHAPILNNHRSEELEDQIGVIVDAKIENQKGVATLKFSKRKSLDDLWLDIKSGILRGISVGYSIDDYEEKEGEDYPTVIGKKWTPFELSLVCIPADEGCYIRNKKIKENKEKMDDKNTTRIPENKEDNTQGIQKKEALKTATKGSDEVLGERSRILCISRLCEQHKVDSATKNELIEKGIKMEEAKDKILKKLQEKQNENHISTLKIRVDESENLRSCLEDSLSYRMGGKLTEKAKKYKNTSLVETARLLTGDRQSSNDQVVTRAMHTTSDFPKILEAAINKTLLSNYEQLQHKQNFWDLCSVSEVKDFKEFNKYRLSEMPGLEPQREGEAIKYGSLSESKISGAISTFAKGISFSRQMLINDDLGAFSGIPAAWASSVIRLENKLFWDHFNNNSTLSTGKKLFSEAHANIAKVNEPLSIDAISKARVQTMRQKSMGGEFELNIVPDTLIVSPEQEMEALKLVSRDVHPTNMSEVNPYKGAFRVMVSPFLKDTKAWYLACSKDKLGPAFQAVYLSGQRIFTDHRVDFNTDSLEYKVRCDLGIIPVEPKALFKNKGVK